MDRGAWRAAVYGVAILRPSPVGVHGEGACVQCRLPRYTLGQPMWVHRLGHNTEQCRRVLWSWTRSGGGFRHNMSQTEKYVKWPQLQLLKTPTKTPTPDPWGPPQPGLASSPPLPTIPLVHCAPRSLAFSSFNTQLSPSQGMYHLTLLGLLHHKSSKSWALLANQFSTQMSVFSEISLDSQPKVVPT